jgi:c-di-GMP-binding flagellar brake protein YcgR
MWIILGVIFVLLIILIVVLRRMGGGNFPWVQFYAKGRESGFAMNEIHLLRKVAVENRLENPTSLFWSIKQLDRSIKGTIIRFRNEGGLTDEINVKFLSKLFDFRRRVELNLPKFKLGLKSSRKIAPHQRIKINLPGAGTYTASVVENLRRYLAISYPEGPVLPDGFDWKGQEINVFFWRGDDAGYVFDSTVLEDYSEKNYAILHIGHSDNLVRSQKRSSVRVDLNKPAYLYLLKSIADANDKEEKTAGLRCRIIDVSEGGAALMIGGKAKVGIAVKLQFNLASYKIRMCGTVKGVSFNPKKNQSILHLQAVSLHPVIRNQLLSFVYNIFGEREPKTNKSRVSSY